MNFKKNQKIVKILEGAGVRSASLYTVEWVRKGKVRCLGDDVLLYDDSTGEEIVPAIPGFRSYLVVLDE